MTNVTIRRELLERIDESAICDGTDATISNDLFTELVATLAAPVQAELTNVRCHCAREYPHDSYDAGFIAGSGMCQVCDASLPAKDIPQQAEPASPWVAVSERLPEPETDVLVRGYKHNSMYHTVAGLFHGEWYSQETEDPVRFEVVEWSPLPPAPEVV